MIQWLLETTVKLAQYGQGIGAASSSRVDRAVLRHLPRNGKKPFVVFDVGANRGDYVQLALNELADSAVIHAFEPGAAAFAELSRRFAGSERLTLNNLALGAEAGERKLHYDVPGSELSSLYKRNVAHHGIYMTASEFVRVDTLDGYCDTQGIERIDLLKLDVEGHELEVLRGAGRIFKQKRIAMVSFEFGGCHVDARTFLRDFFEFFHAHKMHIARVTVSGGLRLIPQYHEGLEQFRTTCFVAW